MPSDKSLTFHAYRYQLLPLSSELQLRFNSPIKSIDDLKAHKNEFFEEALREIQSFQHPWGEIIHELTWLQDDFALLKLATKKDITRKTKDFREEEIDNWPFIVILFDNRPDRQLAYLQHLTTVFQRTSTVSNILQRSFNDELARFHLLVRFNPLFEEREFWELVSKYDERITQAEFDMISPNMSNISESLNLDLRQLSEQTNTKETRLELNSDPEGSLHLTKDDDFIDSLVGYSSEGAGNISLKVRGIKKRFSTKKNATEVTIDEAEIKDADPQTVINVLRGLLS